jgi:hypothetical protein
MAEANHLHLMVPKPQCIFPHPRCALISAQSIKLSESWPKYKIFDFHEMLLKKLAQEQKKVSRRTKM